MRFLYQGSQVDTSVVREELSPAWPGFEAEFAVGDVASNLVVQLWDDDQLQAAGDAYNWTAVQCMAAVSMPGYVDRRARILDDFRSYAALPDYLPLAKDLRALAGMLHGASVPLVHLPVIFNRVLSLPVFKRSVLYFGLRLREDCGLRISCF